MMRVAFPLFFLPALLLQAQDAGMVLRTSVTYNTQRATATLTDEQRSKVDQLGREAQQAGQAQKYGEAMRLYYQGLAVMRNVAWTPALELAQSLQARVDHAVVEPGRTVTLTLTPLYPVEPSPALKMKAALVLVPVRKEGAAEAVLAPARAVEPAALPLSAAVKLPEVAAGDYNVEVRLTHEGAAVPPAAFVKAVPVHIEALAAEAARLRTRLAAAGKKDGSALPTAEYALALYDAADSGSLNPARYNLREEFAAAHKILDALEKGRDPFAAGRGDMRKAYRSAVDQTLQPYRVFVPAAYDTSKTWPLVVALHGMGGDENDMMNGYGGSVKREAERLGFLVVSPKGRDSASMYRGPAEQDVLDVLAEVRRDYKVDPRRIYLMGHSMGGYGTWSVAMAHPETFAALGPVAGGGNPAGMVRIKHIPQYVVHGDDDRTVNVSQSRRMVEAGKQAGASITYVEVPGGSHGSVVAPQIGPMFDFFARQAKAE